ncbi:MAG: hypothetical protein MUO50_20470 [Longimicrobiales bacterium]|nr:hypothetical protein [Longimicrobiales bacterium]
MPAELTFRPFSSMEEYEDCTKLQEEVWGQGFSEGVSAAILMIANRLGGLAAGAYDENGVLQGFVFGLTGVVDGRLIHWSDMLAVRREGRDLGLGTRLKRYQRSVLLERGVREMRWTFDPLQSRNAYVNFSKLGVVCRDYVEDMYGETGSPLHRGIGTDRLVAIWDMASERAETRLVEGGGGPSMEELSQVPQLLPTITSGPFPSPGAPKLGLDDPLLLLAVPGAVDAIMEGDMPLAIRWRKATREVFLHYFSRGYEAREFIRGEGRSYYLLVGPGEGGEAGPGGIFP